VCVCVCVCVCVRMDKEEGQKEGVERERRMAEGSKEKKRGMRVILTRNDWWEKGGGGGGGCKHSHCDGFHTILGKGSSGLHSQFPSHCSLV